MCLLSICMLWRNVYLSSACFSIGLFVFSLLSLYELVVYFGDKALISCMICKYFLLFNRLSFHLFMVSFAVQKLVSLIKSHLFLFAFISIALGDRPKKTLVRFMSENVLPMFSSRNFMISCLIFNSLIHFEFMFMYDVRVCSNFIDIHVAVRLECLVILESKIVLLPNSAGVIVKRNVNWPKGLTSRILAAINAHQGYFHPQINKATKWLKQKLLMVTFGSC